MPGFTVTATTAAVCDFACARYTFYLVVVHVEIVGRAKDGDERREARRLGLSVHAISGVLSLVRPYDAEQIVVLQKVATRRVTASRHYRSIA